MTKMTSVQLLNIFAATTLSCCINLAKSIPSPTAFLRKKLTWRICLALLLTGRQEKSVNASTNSMDRSSEPDLCP